MIQGNGELKIRGMVTGDSVILPGSTSIVKYEPQIISRTNINFQKKDKIVGYRLNIGCDIANYSPVDKSNIQTLISILNANELIGVTPYYSASYSYCYEYMNMSHRTEFEFSNDNDSGIGQTIPLEFTFDGIIDRPVAWYQSESYSFISWSYDASDTIGINSSDDLLVFTT